LQLTIYTYNTYTVPNYNRKKELSIDDDIALAEDSKELEDAINNTAADNTNNIMAIRLSLTLRDFTRGIVVVQGNSRCST
jgi:hypothetical protein